MKDKDIKTINLQAIDPRKVNIPSPKETDDKKGFVSFGDCNAYPDFLFDCYSDCSILQSICNGMRDYACGSGFENASQNDKVINRKGETLIELVKNVAMDYIIFGAGCMEIIRNIKGSILEVNWLDVRKVRLDENEKFVYYRKDWSKYSQAKDTKKYDRWKSDIKYDICIYYFKRPGVRGVYGLPMWSSVVKDVMTSIEISKFHLNGICNNFAPSAIVNFNNGEPSDEEKRTIERKLNEKFSGAENASRMLLSFNSNKEQAVTIERLSEDNFDQKYAALSTSVRQNIFIAFRAIPQLFGCDPERTGFNSNEYNESFKLFKKTVVAPLQSEIEKAFSKIDPAFEFTLKEFTIDFDNNTQAI